MNSIKKISIAISLIALGLTSSYAQEGPTKEERKTKQQEMVNRLNLTSTQEASMKSIKEKYRPQLKALKESPETKEVKKPKRQVIKQEMDAEVKLVLDSVQYEEYLKIKEEKKAKRKANK